MVTVFDFLLYFAVGWLLIIAISSNRRIRNRLRDNGVYIFPLLILIKNTRIEKVLRPLFSLSMKTTPIILKRSQYLLIGLIFGLPILFLYDLTSSIGILMSLNPIGNFSLNDLLVIIIPVFFAGFLYIFGGVAFSSMESFALLILGYLPLPMLLDEDKRKIRKPTLEIHFAGLTWVLIGVIVIFPLLMFPSIVSLPFFVQDAGATVIEVYHPELTDTLVGEIITSSEVLDEFNLVTFSAVIDTKEDFIVFIQGLSLGQRIRVNLLSNLTVILPVLSDTNTLDDIGILVDDHYRSRITESTSLVPFYLDAMITWFVNISLLFVYVTLTPMNGTSAHELYKEWERNASGLTFYGFRVLRYGTIVIFLLFLVQTFFL